MTIEEFIENSRTFEKPDATWPPALQALWHAERGEWDTAHEVCQTGNSRDGAWVHANLHREEGDLSNASYWYGRAGKPDHEGDIVEERREILQDLLSRN
jgi:hypothetical protein